MLKRWLVGGIWALLSSAGILSCVWNVKAEQPAKPGKVLISEVIIHGNQLMSAEQIKVRLRTQAGNEYNPAVVDEDVRELYNTNQFGNITTFHQEDGAGKARIYFCVREMPNTVQKVTFLGAKHIKPEELQNITGVQPGMPLNPILNRHGCQRIIDKYAEMGRPFSDCQLIKGGDRSDTEVVYQITEGKKVKVHDIRFTGNSFVSRTQLMTQLRSSANWFHQPGCTYHKQLVESEIGELYKYYRSFGYQDVVISLETQRSADSREVTLIFHIQEGGRYKLQGMPVIYGAKDIPYDQMTALSILKPGDYFDQSKISASARAIADYIRSIRQGAADVRVDPVPVWLLDRPEICNVRYEVIEQPSRD